MNDTSCLCHTVPHTCFFSSADRMEPRLEACLLALVAASVIPPGGLVLDAGANDGWDTIVLDRIFNASSTRILGLEPLRVNVRKANERARRGQPGVGRT